MSNCVVSSSTIQASVSWSWSILLFFCHRQYPNVLLQVMSMDSRIANKDKTILSLQLEELEPVFMGKIAKTWSFSSLFWYVCNPLFMVLCVGVLYPYLLAFVANIYFNADTHTIVLHPHILYMLCIMSWYESWFYYVHTSNCLVLITMITNLCSPGIFTVEMCAKIFAMGFICHENSYLRYCHLSMLVCSIRIVPQGKLQLVLILAIMSLGRVITIFLKKSCWYVHTVRSIK